MSCHTVQLLLPRMDMAQNGLRGAGGQQSCTLIARLEHNSEARTYSARSTRMCRALPLLPHQVCKCPNHAQLVTEPRLLSESLSTKELLCSSARHSSAALRKPHKQRRMASCVHWGMHPSKQRRTDSYSRSGQRPRVQTCTAANDKHRKTGGCQAEIILCQGTYAKADHCCYVLQVMAHICTAGARTDTNGSIAC
jgi:hypothetical protein